MPAAAYCTKDASDWKENVAYMLGDLFTYVCLTRNWLFKFRGHQNVTTNY